MCPLDLGILNSVCNGDLQGRYTYISETANNVNDYYLVCFDFLDLVFTRCKLYVTEKLKSNHLPPEFYIDKLLGENKCKHNTSDLGQFIEKFDWEVEHKLVGWCFERSKPQKITSGRNTNFTQSPSYSFHKSSYHKSSYF